MYFNDIKLSSGTSFLLTSGEDVFLFTNRHNFTARDNNNGELISKETGAVPNKIKIRHNKKNSLGSFIDKTEMLYEDGDIFDDKKRWIEMPLSSGSLCDVVCIRLSDLDSVEPYSYDDLFQKSESEKALISPAEGVSVIGFPFGVSAGEQPGQAFPIWMNGIIASEVSLNYNGLPCFLIDCRARPGQSGSPVIALRSSGGVATDGATVIGGDLTTFLGIYSGRINNESDIGIVWKESVVLDLFSKAASGG